MVTAGRGVERRLATLSATEQATMWTEIKIEHLSPTQNQQEIQGTVNLDVQHLSSRRDLSFRV